MAAKINNETLRLEFASRLNSACNDAGLPPIGVGRASVIAAEIALRTGNSISIHAVSKWLEGFSIPTHANIRALADMLGVRAEWLQFNQPPRAGSVVIADKARPLTTRLSTKIARLEELGLLNRKLFASIDALLNAAIPEV